jgi:hypothetical protein
VIWKARPGTSMESILRKRHYREEEIVFTKEL